MHNTIDGSPVVLGMNNYGDIGKRLSKVLPKGEYVVADVWPDNHVTTNDCSGNDLKSKPDQLLAKYGHSFFVIEKGRNKEPNKIILIYTGPKLGIEKRVPDSVAQILRGETIH